MALTHDDIRAAGGVVHGDGNIFFTSIDKLHVATAPLLEQIAQLKDDLDTTCKREHGYVLRTDALIAQLEQQLAEAKRQMESQKDEWLSWEAKRKGLKKDAERYRWLRKQDDEDFCFAVVKNPHFDVYETSEELDAAIDAAIARTQES